MAEQKPLVIINGQPQQLPAGDNLPPAVLGFTPENAANKDASGGYPGLDLFKLKLRNAANTFTSFLTNAATAAHTWMMPDKPGTIALTNDKLSAFAATTSAELAGVLSDETGDGGGFVRANNATLSAPLALATLADNTDSLRLADAKFVNQELAKILNRKSNSQGVLMDAAASGGGGIVVPDNSNLNFSTGSYTLFFSGTLPDYTPSATQVMLLKGDNASTGFNFSFEGGTGNLRTRIGVNAYNSSVAAPSIMNGSFICAAVVINTVAATASFYLNGRAVGTPVAITATDVSTTNAFQILGDAIIGARYAGIAKTAYLFNLALSSDEILFLTLNGLDAKFKWGSQTAQTSGLLTTGKQYRINTYVASDNFLNVGAASNASGVEFTATGTTPTTWTNSSSLVQIGAVIGLEPEGINFSGWFDSSTNGLKASYPAAGFSQIRDVVDNGKRLPATAVTGSATLTIAQLLTREIQDTHASGATATYTLPTAALMNAALPTFSIGTSFEWCLINLSAAAADTCTIAAGTGHTIVGNAVIQSAHATTGALYGSTGLFRTKKTAAATYVTSRIG